MKAKILFLLMSLTSVSIALNANNDIPLREGNLPGAGEPTDPRSIECEVTASIDGQVVTVSFSELTASQIVVTDSANQTVFDQTYTAAYSAQANLSLLPCGNYTLYVYVSGTWWYGGFILQ